jgi:ribosomal protein S18 acetylase RimI-like enzyme
MPREDDERVRVRRASAADLPAMARCHLACFPDQLTSRMGLAYAAALYAFYLSHPDGISLVATDPFGELLGLCVGGAPGIYGEFRIAALRRFAGMWLRRMLTDRLVRRFVLARVRAALTPYRRASEDGASEAARGRWAKLQIIAVLAHARGAGVADRLIAAFGAACAAAGYDGLRLAVQCDNARALAFYRRHGWRDLGAHGKSLHLWRALGPGQGA